MFHFKIRVGFNKKYCFSKKKFEKKGFQKNIGSRKKYGIPKKILGFKLKLRRKQCFCKLKNELKIEETQVSGPKIIRNFDLKTHIFFRLRRKNPYFFSASPKTNMQKTHSFFFRLKKPIVLVWVYWFIHSKSHTGRNGQIFRILV